VGVAVDWSAVLTNELPRSDDVVQQLAGPRDRREQQGRRQFRIVAAVLLGAMVLFVFATGGALQLVGGALSGCLLLMWLVLWLGVRASWGHADELVRNGVAYSARVETRLGRSVTRWVIWKVADGREQQRALPPRMPSPPSEVIVLVASGTRQVGIVATDSLYII
jgi:hypothetical protein